MVAVEQERCPKCSGRLMRVNYGDDERGCWCGWRATRVLTVLAPARKRCPHCRRDLALAAFAASPRTADGRSAWCTHCQERNREQKARARARKEVRGS